MAVAFGLYLAAVVITFAVNEPLNEKLRDAGDPDSILSCGRDLQWCRTHNTATGRNIDSTRDEIEEA